MDPIRPKSFDNAQPVGPTSPTDTGKTDKKFEIAGAAPTSSTGQPTVIGRPNFDRIATKIQDGVGRSLNRDQVRDEVISSETKEMFGQHATPQMAAAVSDAFKNDPHLSNMFSQLYSKAVNKT